MHTREDDLDVIEEYIVLSGTKQQRKNGNLPPHSPKLLGKESTFVINFVPAFHEIHYR